MTAKELYDKYYTTDTLSETDFLTASTVVKSSEYTFEECNIMEESYFKKLNLNTIASKLVSEYQYVIEKLYDAEYLKPEIKTALITKCTDMVNAIMDVDLTAMADYLKDEFYNHAKKILVEEIATPNGIATHFYTDNKVLFNKLIVYPEYVCQKRK